MMGEYDLAAGRTGVRTNVVGLPREVEEELLCVEEAIRNANPGDVVFCRVAPRTVNAPAGQRSCQQQQHAEHPSATSTRTPPPAWRMAAATPAAATPPTATPASRRRPAADVQVGDTRRARVGAVGERPRRSRPPHAARQPQPSAGSAHAHGAAQTTMAQWQIHWCNQGH